MIEECGLIIIIFWKIDLFVIQDYKFKLINDKGFNLKNSVEMWLYIIKVILAKC